MRRKPGASKRAKRTPEQAAKATHTGWIRDSERAMRASTSHPTAKLIYAEMIDHTSEQDRTCWASKGSIAIATNLTVPTVDKYQKQLEAQKQIERRGKTRRGTIIWGFPDAWANGVLDSLAIKLDAHREKEAARQAGRRAKYRGAVTQHSLRPTDQKSRKDVFVTSRKDIFDEHLKRTPIRTSTEERDNAYAIAKGLAE